MTGTLHSETQVYIVGEIIEPQPTNVMYNKQKL